MLRRCVCLHFLAMNNLAVHDLATDQGGIFLFHFLSSLYGHLTIITLKEVFPSLNTSLLIADCVSDTVCKALANTVPFFHSLLIPFQEICKFLKMLQSPVLSHLKLSQGHRRTAQLEGGGKEKIRMLRSYINVLQLIPGSEA